MFSSNRRLKSVIYNIIFSLFFSYNAFAQPLQARALDWLPCHGDQGDNFECAQLEVPLNHQEALEKGAAFDGETILISLVRLPAAPEKRDSRIGSLFLNPGGPGGSGIELVLNSGRQFFESLEGRYDIIGFDPRGFGESHPLKCIRSPEDIFEYLNQPKFPLTDEEAAARIKIAATLADRCRENGGDLLWHMTTADVARDMELMRRAVGDERLNYYGFSYGSYIGATYANLFPDRVGAMVIDGVGDPIAYSTGTGWEHHFSPVLTRSRKDKGTLDTLHEFFRLCELGGRDVCPLAGNAEERYDRLARELKEEPMVITPPGGKEIWITYDRFIGTTVGYLDDPEKWHEFSQLLDDMEARVPSKRITDWGESFELTKEDFEEVEADGLMGQTIADALTTICTDSSNPASGWLWDLAAKRAEMEYGYFSRYFTWQSDLCMGLKPAGEARFIGPFNHITANPILMVSRYYDPATPHEGALRLASLMPNSRLLSIKGWGHSGFISSCANAKIIAFFLSGDLPAEGEVCIQDEEVPFGLSPQEATRDMTPPKAWCDGDKCQDGSSKYSES